MNILVIKNFFKVWIANNDNVPWSANSKIETFLVVT